MFILYMYKGFSMFEKKSICINHDHSFKETQTQHYTKSNLFQNDYHLNSKLKDSLS